MIALRQAAAQCQATIHTFGQKILKYQPSLRSGGSGNKVKGLWKNGNWELLKKDDLAMLEADLAGHTAAINLLLSSIQLSHSRKFGLIPDATSSVPDPNSTDPNERTDATVLAAAETMCSESTQDPKSSTVQVEYGYPALSQSQQDASGNLTPYEAQKAAIEQHNFTVQAFPNQHRQASSDRLTSRHDSILNLDDDDLERPTTALLLGSIPSSTTV